jgi:DNA-binding ferritin-like protein
VNNLAALLRAMQLYAHAAHNLACGKTFFEDHEVFGEFYAEFEAQYDEVVERIIGLTGDCDVIAITKMACDIVEKTKVDSSERAFSILLASEKNLCKLATEENKRATLGTQDLLQKIANGSEVRQYKISRKLCK